MANEKNKISKSNWVNRFKIIGKPRINDYTFKIDEHSSKSSWIYNSMNLGIDAGEKYGVCYASLMGGYSSERENKLYAHGKDENGRDDYSNRIEVDWEERFDDSVLDEIGEQCFIRVGIEKTDKGKVFIKKFLSAYDAVNYVYENLTDDMVICVTGDIRYGLYNDNVTINKDIKSIRIWSVNDQNDFHAKFTQSILIDSNSTNMRDVDKSTGNMPIDAIVLDYIKEINGHEVKGQFPFHVNMEYHFDLSNKNACKTIYNKLFKVNKGYTQITFEGDFISENSTVNVTVDDLPDDIKELVDCGIYTEEEALKECASTSGTRENHMFVRKPSIFMVGDGDNKLPTVQKFEEAYMEDELDFSWAYEDVDDEDEDDDPPFGKPESESVGNTGDDDDMSWLDMM